MSGQDKVEVFLGFGGNIGDPRRAMVEALHTLDADRATRVDAVSALYRTPPWGKLDQPDYLNAVARLSTTLSPRALLALCLETEKRLKRVRAERWGPRLIDIDLLVFGDRTVEEDGLRIPHSRMLERAFVMTPLAEIAPTLLLDGKSAEFHAERLGREGLLKQTEDAGWWRN